MKHVFFLCFFTALSLSIKAEDPMGGNFLTLQKSYDFELPVFDLSLKLPANAGFRVPFWSEENAFLNINERNVSYCCNKAAILGGNPEFTFSLPEQNTKALGLSFENASITGFEKNLKEIRESNSYLSDLPPLKSRLGTFYGFLTGEENWKMRFYFLQKDGLSLVLAIYPENEKEIKQCENIILSLRAVNLKEKREKYLKMVETGYFEKQGNAGLNTFVADTTQVLRKKNIPAADVETVPASFKDAGISFKLPLLYSTYCFPEKNCFSGDKNIVVAGKPSDDKGNLSITTMSKDNKEMISVALSILYSEQDFDTYFRTMVENWKTYNFFKVKRTEFAIVNGQKWGIMEYVQSGQSVCMYMTFYNNYLITVSYSGNSKEYKALTENMLFSFFK